MKPVSPVMPGSESIEVLIGAGEPNYIPLPAVYLNTPTLQMISRWEFTAEEREIIANGADVILTQLTFGQMYQPIHLQVTARDEMPLLVSK